MTSDLDEALAGTEPPDTPALSTYTERKCNHLPRSSRILDGEGELWRCTRCGATWTAQASRKGRQSRNYGNRFELAAARLYGGQKVGHAGGPVDVRGEDFDTQVRTKRRLPPAEWTAAINAMAAGNRCPRMLIRYVFDGGPEDWFVFRAKDFLEWFGRDE